MEKKIEILIVDDHTIFREGLKFILNNSDSFKVIGDADNGKSCLEILSKYIPDIVLMDIEMPILNGIDTTELITQNNTKTRVIALSSYGDEVYYYKMIKAGASGFILKNSGKKELEDAILQVYNGKNFFSPELLHKIVYKVSHEGEKSLYQNEISITKRELEVLSLIGQGYSNKEIGNKLFISPKTVDNHRTNLLSKTGTKNSASLIMYAIKNKIITV